MSDQVERDGLRNWDVDSLMSSAALERIMRALVTVGGHFTCAHTYGGQHYRHQPVMFRIWLPVGTEEQFREIAKVEIKPPPRVDLGWSGGIE